MDVFENISIDSLLEYWSQVRKSIRDCLNATPTGLLSWAPKEGMRTLGQLYVDLATSIDWWLTTAFNEDDNRPPSSRHSTEDRNYLDRHLEQSFERLERFLGIANLSEMYESRGRKLRGAWIVLHMFKQDIYHQAQIIDYLRQNGIDPPISDMI